MSDYPLPVNEAERLESLKALNLLDTPAEERFDRITRVARDAFDVDYSAINLIDEDRQWSKSTCGIDRIDSPREESFCTYTILEESITETEDAQEDERFQDSKFVQNDPNVRFYMGVPLHSPDGNRIGSLCVFDTEARKITEKDRRLLKNLASIADSEIERDQSDVERSQLREQLEEAERRSRIDGLTDLWNRRAIMDLLKSEANRSSRENIPMAIAMIDIDNFKSINDDYGHQAGDEFLRRISQELRQCVREYDVVGRYGGEEFIIIFPESDYRDVEMIAERILERVENLRIQYDSQTLRTTLSMGITVRDPDKGVTDSVESLIKEADRSLYEAKNTGKNKICYHSRTDV